MNLSMFLTKNAKLFPDKLCIIHGDRQLTYAQFNARVNRLANFFRRLGLQKGDNVAILQYNYPETLESLFACFKGGFGAVPINFRLHPKEYAFIIDNSESKAVILSQEFNEAILGIRDRIPKAEYLITLENNAGELLDYESSINESSDEFADIEVAPDHLAWLFYTSGTTGRPKGAMLTHRNLLAMSMSFYADMVPGFTHNDSILHAAPLSHGSGLYALPNIGKGGTNIILPSKSFDPEIVFQAIEKYKVTNMFAAPTMVKMLIDHPAIDSYDFSSLRSLIYGGAPFLGADLKKAIEKMEYRLVQLFGQGETPMTISYLPNWAHKKKRTPIETKRLNSAGFAHTDVEVNIFDEEGNELPTGEIGEIVTRSEIVMKGYWRNSEATSNAIKNGWLYTGDVGYLDENGYLFIMDRSKDMIISGGENVYPREIEEVLVCHPAVSEVAVIGVPDPKWGEAIKAVVVLIPGRTISEQELIEFCKENIASYKKPKSIDFVKKLPKSNYGKILKRELREIH